MLLLELPARGKHMTLEVLIELTDCRGIQSI